MMQDPVNGGGADGLVHERVDPSRVKARGHDDDSTSGGYIRHDEVGTGDLLDGACNGSMDDGASDGGGKGLKGEPGHASASVDDSFGDGFDEVALPVPEGLAMVGVSLRATQCSTASTVWVAGWRSEPGARSRQSCRRAGQHSYRQAGRRTYAGAGGDWVAAADLVCGWHTRHFGGSLRRAVAVATISDSVAGR